MLEQYYAQKDQITRIRQKSATCAELSRPLWNATAKNTICKTKQMKDTEKMDKYKVYGELINTYGYNLESGCKSSRL